MDPEDGIVVLREHLEYWADVLRRNLGHLTALDLAHAYREGRPHRSTQLTRMTETTTNRIEGYLHVDDALPTN